MNQWNWHRHKIAAKINHQVLALKCGFRDQKFPYYEYSPEPDLENDQAKLGYWDQPIITERTILGNKPHIVLMGRASSYIFLVDITIPHGDNLVTAESGLRLETWRTRWSKCMIYRRPRLQIHCPVNHLCEVKMSMALVVDRRHCLVVFFFTFLYRRVVPKTCI